MGDPYLSSDESLILSTHNIRIDGVYLDLMLTSRRLILIDNSATPFQLRTIPLETIITVFAGMDVKGDPIITLSHMDPSGTGAPHPMDFIFTQQKGEQRTKECNEWAATLGDYAVKARDGALSAGTLPYDPVKAIQPRMSVTYRIETFGPHKQVIGERAVTAEPVMSPALPDAPVDKGISAGTKEPAPLNDAGPVESFDSFRPPSEEPSKTEVTDAEEPVSLPVITPETGENPATSDAARAWAEAVRTVIIPVPAILPIPVLGPIPAVEPIETEPKADLNPIRPTPEEPVAKSQKEICSASRMSPECPADGKPVQQPAPETARVPAAISSPALNTRKRSFPFVLIAAIIIIILVVMGAVVIGSFYPRDSVETPPPVVVTVVTVQPTPTPLPAQIPVDGVWVRIKYPQTFIGEVGNPELMHPASGTGVQLYKILWSDRVVKASVQKQDNSGDTLLIEVYRNGTLLKHSSTRVPMGSVQILIDPITGQPPGITYGDIPGGS
ncbi:MAG: hypothetical protein WC620_05235 [Methanoregula sp.]|jgi:hypothetical protein